VIDCAAVTGRLGVISGTWLFAAVCCVLVGLLGRPFWLLAAEPVRLTQDGRFKMQPRSCVAEGREIVYYLPSWPIRHCTG